MRNLNSRNKTQIINLMKNIQNIYEENDKILFPSKGYESLDNGSLIINMFFPNY